MGIFLYEPSRKRALRGVKRGRRQKRGPAALKKGGCGREAEAMAETLAIFKRPAGISLLYVKYFSLTALFLSFI
jgi:hypothetical protein